MLIVLALGCRGEDGIQVKNSTPTVEIVYPFEDTLIEPESIIEFQANVSDANHKFEELSISWMMDQQEICPPLPPDESGLSTCTANISEGSREVVAQVVAQVVVASGAAKWLPN